MTDKEKMVSRTKVLKCTCEHADQDKLYGSKMRVHNKMKEAAGIADKGRCTVCGTERNWGS